MDRFHIIQDLLWLGSADEYTGDLLMVEQPAKCHICKLFSSLRCQIVQSADLVQTLRCQCAFFQESSVFADTAVLRDSVQVAVCQLSLCKRAEGDEAFFQDAGGSLQAVLFHSSVKNGIPVLIDHKRAFQIFQDRCCLA